MERSDEDPAAAMHLPKLKLVEPLVTVMGVTRKSDYGEVQGPTIVSHATSSEILHYADAHERASNNDVVNAGIYYISTQIYKEFDKEHPITVFDIDHSGKDTFGEGNPVGYEISDGFDIEMASL